MSEFEAEKTAAAKGPCDCGCGDCGDKAKPALVEAQPNSDRRKLLFGGVIATPAIVMLSSRSALATGSNGGQCTASAHFSVNLSKPKATGCKSLSPGCWRTTRNWPAPFNAGLPNPINGSWNFNIAMNNPSLSSVKDWFKSHCTNGNTSKAWTMTNNWQAIVNSATQCSSYFPWAPTGPNAKSFMQALWDNSDQVLRKSVACVLNAQQFGQQAFGYTVAEIVALINQRHNDPTFLADLDYLTSDRGGSCPQDGGQINWCTVCA
jgi:hypothetical protein